MTTREINRLLREAAKAGQAEIVLEHPDARHNLGVALLDPVRVRIEGSVGIPLNHLAERIGELPKNRPLLLYCAGGYRSSIAASLLQSHGFGHVAEITGGITAWEAANLPVERAQA